MNTIICDKVNKIVNEAGLGKMIISFGLDGGAEEGCHLD